MPNLEICFLTILSQSPQKTKMICIRITNVCVLGQRYLIKSFKNSQNAKHHSFRCIPYDYKQHMNILDFKMSKRMYNSIAEINKQYIPNETADWFQNGCRVTIKNPLPRLLNLAGEKSYGYAKEHHYKITVSAVGWAFTLSLILESQHSPFLFATTVTLLFSVFICEASMNFLSLPSLHPWMYSPWASELIRCGL